MLFSFVDSEASADMLEVLKVSIPYNEKSQRLPGIALLIRMPTGNEQNFYLNKNFAVYFPESLDT
jgi:hypothetical protein